MVNRKNTSSTPLGLKGLQGNKMSPEEELIYNLQSDRLSNLIGELKRLNDNLGDGFELKNTIEVLEDSAKMARRKNRELEILSFFAFNSNHEAITDQRRNLFLSTKLVYENQIREILDNLDDYDNQMDSSDTSPCEAIESNHNSLIMDYFYVWTKKIRLIKKVIWSKNV